MWLILSSRMMAATADPSCKDALQQEVIAHDAGPVLPHTELAYEFPMVNDSLQAWDFLSTETSCSCTLASRLPPVLRPGEQSAFRLSFRAGTAGRPLPTIASVECVDAERMTEILKSQALRMATRFRAIGATGKASSRVILHLEDGECFHVPYLAAIAKPAAAAAP